MCQGGQDERKDQRLSLSIVATTIRSHQPSTSLTLLQGKKKKSGWDATPGRFEATPVRGRACVCVCASGDGICVHSR